MLGFKPEMLHKSTGSYAAGYRDVIAQLAVLEEVKFINSALGVLLEVSSFRSYPGG